MTKREKRIGQDEQDNTTGTLAETGGEAAILPVLRDQASFDGFLTRLVADFKKGERPQLLITITHAIEHILQPDSFRGEYNIDTEFKSPAKTPGGKLIAIDTVKYEEEPLSTAPGGYGIAKAVVNGDFDKAPGFQDAITRAASLYRRIEDHLTANSLKSTIKVVFRNHSRTVVPNTQKLTAVVENRARSFVIPPTPPGR